MDWDAVSVRERVPAQQARSDGIGPDTRAFTRSLQGLRDRVTLAPSFDLPAPINSLERYSMALDDSDYARYQRQLILAGFGPAAQERLKRASVLVIGAGGLGCPALLYLAAAGVGRLVVIDDDRVDVSNLQRQVLYTTEDAGQSKATCAARRLAALNPLITIEAVTERLTVDNALRWVQAVDLVLDGSDNFGTRYLVNDACVILGRPFVYGAIQGFAGQVSVFNHRGGPTYRCLFPEAPEPGLIQNCAEAGVLGVLPGIVGTVQANEAIKVLTGVGEPLSGQLWLLDALTMRTDIVTLAADPAQRKARELRGEEYAATCRVDDSPGTAPSRDEIAPTELDRLLNAPAPIQLIDVREAWERAEGTIASDVHVPLQQIIASGAPTLDSGATTVVYCASGRRSLQATRTLRAAFGFRNVRSLQGGFGRWRIHQTTTTRTP